MAIKKACHPMGNGRPSLGRKMHASLQGELEARRIAIIAGRRGHLRNIEAAVQRSRARTFEASDEKILFV
jgi:hypothetical protein